MGTGIRNIKESKILKNILDRKGALSALIIYCKDMYEVSLYFKTENNYANVWLNKQNWISKIIFSFCIIHWVQKKQGCRFWNSEREKIKRSIHDHIFSNFFLLISVYLFPSKVNKKLINTTLSMSSQTISELMLFHTIKKINFLFIFPISYYSKYSEENWKWTGWRNNNIYYFHYA